MGTAPTLMEGTLVIATMDGKEAAVIQVLWLLSFHCLCFPFVYQIDFDAMASCQHLIFKLHWFSIRLLYYSIQTIFIVFVYLQWVLFLTIFFIYVSLFCFLWSILKYFIDVGTQNIKMLLLFENDDLYICRLITRRTHGSLQ